MAGFFAAAPTSPPPGAGRLLPACGACGLWQGCKSPKMPVTGQGRKGILIVAEAPGEEEDLQGTQLIGKAGRLLRRELEELCDINLDIDCWKTNTLICRPPENRMPTNDEIDYCRPNLDKAIRELNPRMVVPLGAAAVRGLLGPLWRADVGPIGDWVGWCIPSRRYNAWICPTWHPSYINRSENDRNFPALRIWWRRHLMEMFSLEGRPWPSPPRDYAADIRLVYDPADAALILDKWTVDGGRITYDYETNRLQPYYPDSEIVSCAVCWRGRECIAFPWAGAVIPAMRRLLASPCPKVGANIKFESQWSHVHLGVWPENWIKDVMQDAHILDNRPNITSVKFQAFVRLGLEPWNAYIKPYLEDVDGTGKNRIRELAKSDLRSLLLYNGIDAWAEDDIAIHQREEWKNAGG